MIDKLKKFVNDIEKNTHLELRRINNVYGIIFHFNKIPTTLSYIPTQPETKPITTVSQKKMFKIYTRLYQPINETNIMVDYKKGETSLQTKLVTIPNELEPIKMYNNLLNDLKNNQYVTKTLNTINSLKITTTDPDVFTLYQYLILPIGYESFITELHKYHPNEQVFKPFRNFKKFYNKSTILVHKNKITINTPLTKQLIKIDENNNPYISDIELEFNKIKNNHVIDLFNDITNTIRIMSEKIEKPKPYVLPLGIWITLTLSNITKSILNLSEKLTNKEQGETP